MLAALTGSGDAAGRAGGVSGAALAMVSGNSGSLLLFMPGLAAAEGCAVCVRLAEAPCVADMSGVMLDAVVVDVSGSSDTGAGRGASVSCGAVALE